jgi:hypothetical protein
LNSAEFNDILLDFSEKWDLGFNIIPGLQSPSKISALASVDSDGEWATRCVARLRMLYWKQQIETDVLNTCFETFDVKATFLIQSWVKKGQAGSNLLSDGTRSNQRSWSCTQRLELRKCLYSIVHPECERLIGLEQGKSFTRQSFDRTSTYQDTSDPKPGSPSSKRFLPRNDQLNDSPIRFSIPDSPLQGKRKIDGPGGADTDSKRFRKPRPPTPRSAKASDRVHTKTFQANLNSWIRTKPSGSIDKMQSFAGSFGAQASVAAGINPTKNPSFDSFQTTNTSFTSKVTSIFSTDEAGVAALLSESFTQSDLEESSTNLEFDAISELPSSSTDYGSAFNEEDIDLDEKINARTSTYEYDDLSDTTYTAHIDPIPTSCNMLFDHLQTSSTTLGEKLKRVFRK